MMLLYNVLRSVSRAAVAMSAGSTLKATELRMEGKDTHEWVGLALVTMVLSIASFYMELQCKVKGPNE